MELMNSWERKGLEKGEIKKAKDIAKGMLAEGFTIEMIAKLTKLSKDEVKALAKELNK
ncbi:hypothetical protein ACJ2A9_23335 [Anaerobacillus sp. MEB173]|uniref:hypothetical protein n=1 Tax=Anaerobacillus sp. MEB173 TaxID=3383345 RepID=UPI003F8DA6B7